jgi:hypothetical protein
MAISSFGLRYACRDLCGLMWMHSAPSPISWRPIPCITCSSMSGVAPTSTRRSTCRLGLREKRRDLAFDNELGATQVTAWAGEIDHVLVRGNVITTEAVLFHRQSGTVLFADLIQNFHQDWFSGWRAIVARLDLMIAPEPSVPRKFRTTFVNRSAARTSVGQILSWPAEKVLMAHGDPVTEDGRAFIARAFQWLVGDPV